MGATEALANDGRIVGARMLGQTDIDPEPNFEEAALEILAVELPAIMMRLIRAQVGRG
jgi:hypothetical protein